MEKGQEPDFLPITQNTSPMEIYNFLVRLR